MAKISLSLTVVEERDKFDKPEVAGLITALKIFANKNGIDRVEVDMNFDDINKDEPIHRHPMATWGRPDGK